MVNMESTTELLPLSELFLLSFSLEACSRSLRGHIFMHTSQLLDNEWTF